jgi:uncharacterized membrane protein YphA (DoxX/SURF4 family)
MKPMDYVYIAARIFIGGMFIYTGIIHILDPVGFAKAITNYQLLPFFSINIFAIILPWTELLAGIAILINRLEKGGSLITSLMLAAFTVALAISLYRGLSISCGCFSTNPEAEKISWLYLIRDSVLFLISAGIFLYSAIRNRDTYHKRRPRPCDGPRRKLNTIMAFEEQRR